jgi:hypothetical protein
MVNLHQNREDKEVKKLGAGHAQLKADHHETVGLQSQT